MERNDKQMKHLIAFLLCLLSAFILFSAISKQEEVSFDSGLAENRTAVNINTAAAEELAEALEGIGETLAERVVAYREENGAFETKEEIMEVKGIGEKIFEKISGQITV